MSLYSPRRVRAQPRLLFLSTDALQEAIQRKKCRRLGCGLPVSVLVVAMASFADRRCLAIRNPLTPQPKEAPCPRNLSHGWKRCGTHLLKSWRKRRPSVPRGSFAMSCCWAAELAIAMPPQRCRQGLPLYENRPIFLDHADEQNSPTRRKLRDFAGQVLAPRYEGERLRGDLRLLGPHAEWLFDLIEAAPHDIGMSHVVLGRRSSQGQLVEQIERVISVDIVAFPATTQSFQEGAVTSWMTELVEQSSLPVTLHRTAQEALATHPEPERLLELLEQWATLLQKESPQSVMRAVATESNALKHSVMQAIRGL